MSLKEHWAAQFNQVYKQQYQRLQKDIMGMKYKMGFFLNEHVAYKRGLAGPPKNGERK